MQKSDGVDFGEACTGEPFKTPVQLSSLVRPGFRQFESINIFCQFYVNGASA
jgi:hypothetical protein